MSHLTPQRRICAAPLARRARRLTLPCVTEPDRRHIARGPTTLPRVAPPKSGCLTRGAAAALLDRLRGATEHGGAPFDVARRALGVTDALDRAWRKRAAELAAKDPDLSLSADGTLRIGGSLEFEAEYARIAATSDARQAAVLTERLTKIALDPAHGPVQLAAIKLQLAALQPHLYGTQRVEAQVSAEVGPAGGGSQVDPAVMEAATPAQRAAVVEAARFLSLARDRWQQALTGLEGGAPEHVADGSDGASTWPQVGPLDGDDGEVLADEDGGAA